MIRNMLGLGASSGPTPDAAAPVPGRVSPELIDLDKADKLEPDSDSESDEGDLEPLPGVPFPTKYEFVHVDIPDSFLAAVPDGEQQPPITYKKIDFASSILPEYSDCYAAVLDNVMNQEECDEFLRMVEASVPQRHSKRKRAQEKKDKEGQSSEQGPETKPIETKSKAWKPALVNVGNGLEVLETSYRNSDRIIWDHQTVVDRIWARCMAAPGMHEFFDAAIENNEDILGPNSWRMKNQKQRWEFLEVNQRMRCLRYGPGQFFRPHCDSPFRMDPAAEGRGPRRTLFTVHLYLNDSRQEVDDVDLVGGATSFLSRDETRKIDVDPKVGRVLIFQHYKLYHCGADVVEGTKYTMRTDIMYERTKWSES